MNKRRSCFPALARRTSAVCVMSAVLFAVLKKAGADATLHVVKGAGHGFGGPEIFKKVKEFFDRTLNPITH